MADPTRPEPQKIDPTLPGSKNFDPDPSLQIIITLTGYISLIFLQSGG